MASRESAIRICAEQQNTMIVAGAVVVAAVVIGIGVAIAKKGKPA